MTDEVEFTIFGRTFNCDVLLGPGGESVTEIAECREDGSYGPPEPALEGHEPDAVKAAALARWSAQATE